MNGHLWVTLAGGSPVVFNILHPLSNVMIYSGLIIIVIGWKKIHAGAGKLVTDGIYKYMRHPQYVGFALAILGFLVQWPTIINILMAPALMYMYTRLSKQEERFMIETFGEQYQEYSQKVPAYFPRLWGNAGKVHDIGYNKA
jgi:protein-S-isoprenylcysteine O-methyltransferase Ste14